MLSGAFCRPISANETNPLDGRGGQDYNRDKGERLFVGIDQCCPSPLDIADDPSAI